MDILEKTMSLQIQSFFDSLPLFWKLATVRLFIYLYVVGVNAWFASVEGFTSIADMTPLEVSKMHYRVALAIATTLIAFLDNGMSVVQKSGSFSADDVKKILSEMTPGASVRSTETSTISAAPREPILPPAVTPGQDSGAAGTTKNTP